MLGGHEHVYLYRKFNNSILLKSGVNFQTFSEVRLSFRESSEFKWKFQPKDNWFQKFHQNDGGRANNSEAENTNYMLNYKSEGKSSESYKSDFYFNDSKMKTQMTFFPSEIVNSQQNQFGRKVQVEVRREDISGLKSTQFLKTTKSFVKLQAHVDKLVQEIEEKGKEPLFHLMSDIDLTSNSVRSKESNMANWVARLIQIESGADVAFLHGGNIRSMRAYPRGHTLTLLDINQMTAIVDHFEYVSVTGRVLLQILENGYRGAPNPLGCFLHPAGLSVVLDISKEYDVDRVMSTQNGWSFERVSQVKMDHGDFKFDKKYVVVGQSFIVEGGDGFHGFKKARSMGVKDKMLTNNQEIVGLARLAKTEKFRNEFLLFKKYLCGHVSDSDMREVQAEKDCYLIDPLNSKIKMDSLIRIQDNQQSQLVTLSLLHQFHLVSNFSKSNFLKMLQTLQVSCIKRLRKYKLISGIRGSGDSSIFEIDPKFYSKVIYK